MAMFLHRYLVEGIDRICSVLFFRQGENLESGLWRLDLVTAALERHYIPEGVAVEEHCCHCGVNR
jgi:hypothetical protein